MTDHTHVGEPPLFVVDEHTPIGFGQVNPAGRRMRWHGWGWAPVEPTKVEAQLIAARDSTHAAKSRYWALARPLGAARMTHAGTNPDGSTYGRYRLGEGRDQPLLTFVEKPGEPARVDLNITATFWKERALEDVTPNDVRTMLLDAIDDAVREAVRLLWANKD